MEKVPVVENCNMVVQKIRVDLFAPWIVKVATIALRAYICVLRMQAIFSISEQKQNSKYHITS